MERSRAVCLRLLKAAALIAVFVLSIPIGALLHLWHPVVARFALGAVNEALERALPGAVILEQVAAVTPNGLVAGVSGRAVDPEGRTVLRIEDASANLDIGRLVYSLWSRGPLRIELSRLRVERASVFLYQDRGDLPSLVDTFVATPLPDEVPAATAPDVEISDFRIGEIAVRSSLRVAPDAEASIRDVRGRFSSSARATSLVIEHSNLEATGIPELEAAEGELDLTFQSSGRETRVSARYSGGVANVPVEASATYEATPGHVEALVAMRDVEPASIRELVGLEVTVPVDVRLQLSGPPESLQIDADVTAGRSALAVAGDVSLRPRLSAELRVETSGLDASVIQGAPRSELSASGRVRLRQAASGLAGEFVVNTGSGRVADVRVPPVSAQGSFDEDTIDASARVDEPGAPTRVELTVELPEEGRGGVIEYELTSTVTSLRDFVRARVPAAGSVLLKSAGQLKLDGPARVNADVELTARDLTLGDDSIGEAELQASVSGPLAQPEVIASGELSRAEVAGIRFESARVSAEGEPSDIAVRLKARGASGQDVRAELQVDALSRQAREVEVRVRRDGDVATARVARIDLGPDGPRLEGIEVAGLGDLSASVSSEGGELELTASARELELAKLSELLGLSLPLRDGRVSFDVRFDRETCSGHLQARAHSLAAYEVRGGQARVDLRLTRCALSGVAIAKTAPIIVKAMTKRIEIPKDDMSLAGLRRITGELAVQADLALGPLAEVIGPEHLPVSRASGAMKLNAFLLRREPRGLPLARLSLHSSGLELAGKTGAEPRERAPRASGPWHLDGTDFVLQALYEAEPRLVRTQLTLLQEDGVLARLTTKAELPGGVTIPPTSDWRRALLELPFRARLHVPTRRLSTLPQVLRPRTTTGLLELVANLEGPIVDPNVRIALQARGLRPEEQPNAAPLTVDLRGSFRDGLGSVSAVVDRHGENLLHGRSQLRANPRDVIAAVEAGTTPPLLASAVLHARGVPLDRFSPLRDARIRGQLHGDVVLAGLGRDARLFAQVSVSEPQLGSVALDSATARLEASGGALRANFALERAGAFARGRLDTGITWGPRITPELDPDSPMSGSLLAKSFPAEALDPLLGEELGEIAGLLDADLSARRVESRDRVEGNIVLRDGRIYVPALGQDLRSVNASVRILPEGVFFVERASARGYSGRVLAAASGRLDGFVPTRVNVVARIPEGESIPVTLQAARLGEAWGELRGSIATQPQARRIDVAISIPELHLSVPATKQSDLQNLEDAPRIRTGTYLGEEFVRLPLEAPEPALEQEPVVYVVKLRLGDDVWLSRGETLEAQITGALAIELARELAVAGELSVPRGTIEVSGKEFSIESATIRFRPEQPTNPVVVASAVWVSPLGYRVIADYTGPVEGGKLTLRSDPALEQNQILALMLFGAPEGQLGTSSGDGATGAAVSLGGGAATQALNRALDDLTTLDVQARVDTTSGTPEPGIEVQLSPRLSAQLRYAVNAPAPGEPADRTFVTLNLRIKRRWWLSATAGDEGSTIWDLVWRYVY